MAEIYKWVDENGEVHYSETAPEETAQPLQSDELPSLNSLDPVDIDRYQSVIDKIATPDNVISTGKSSFTGILRYAGNPVKVSASDDVSTWIRNENTGKGTEYKAVFDIKKGTVSVKNIPPGKYGMTIGINNNRANPKLYPGDYRKWVNFKIEKRKSIRRNIDLEKIIHLIAPQDNNHAIEGWSDYCGNTTSFSSPIRFQWAPISANVEYKYNIQEYTCYPFKFRKNVASGSTSNTSLTLNLGKARGKKFYMLTLNAYKNSRIVGSLMTHGKNGHGWDYRFGIR